MTNDQKEVLELLRSHGGTYFEHITAGPGLFMAKGSVYFESLSHVNAFAAALEEKHRAKIEMLVDELKLLELQDFDSEDAPDCPEEAADICNWLIGQFRSHVESIRRDAQQDTVAFIAEIRAKARLEGKIEALEEAEKKGESERRATVGGFNGLSFNAGADAVLSALKLMSAELRASAAQPYVAKLIPPGWKVVPIEPTEDMIVSGTESWLTIKCMEDRAEAIWKDMLEAAPLPPAPDKQGE